MNYKDNEVFINHKKYNNFVVRGELEKIPFEPRTWNNAVRNVPLTQYGQTPQIEIGHGIQGYSLKGSEATF